MLRYEYCSNFTSVSIAKDHLMKILYRIHRWISAICGAFFLLLCLTGLPLIFSGDVYRWNEIDERPNFGELSYQELWSGMAAGLTQFAAEMPGCRVDAIAAYAERGVLLYSLTWQGDHGNMRRARLAYAPESGEIVPWRSSYVKSPMLAEFMGTMHDLHLRMSMGYVGLIVLTVMCILSLLSVVGGILLYPSFMRRHLFGGTRGGTSAGNFFDWHNFLGMITAVWAVLMTLSGIAIAVYIIGYGSYRADVEAALPLDIRNEEPVGYEEMIVYAQTHFQNQDLLYLAAADEDAPAVMTLTDETRPSMSRGQEVYLIRTEEGLTHITQPIPGWIRLCDALRPFHTRNHETMPLKILWAVLDLLTVIVIVSGFAGWGQRSRRKKEIPPVLLTETCSAVDVWMLPAVFALLSLIGMGAPLSHSTVGNAVGTAAWAGVLLLTIYLWRRGRRYRKRNKSGNS